MGLRREGHMSSELAVRIPPPRRRALAGIQAQLSENAVTLVVEFVGCDLFCFESSAQGGELFHEGTLVSLADVLIVGRRGQALFSLLGLLVLPGLLPCPLLKALPAAFSHSDATARLAGPLLGDVDLELTTVDILAV